MVFTEPRRAIAHKIKKILIAYDGSGYSHAALSGLKQSGLPQEAEVIIAAVSEIWLAAENESAEVEGDPDVSAYYEMRREQSGKSLEETKAIATAARDELLKYFLNWNVSTEVVSGSPATEILSIASEFEPDLIVVGPRGLSSDVENGLGSISYKILAEAKCSVRISRLKGDFLPSKFNILIGFDGSYGSMGAVREVALRPWKTKPEVRLLTVTDPFILVETGRALQPVLRMSEGRIAGEDKWVESLASDALQILLDAGLSATLNTCAGNPRMIFIRKAREWKVDSIFVGAHSCRLKSGFDSIGCVALAIASRSDCSVEVVRELENSS